MTDIGILHLDTDTAFLEDFSTQLSEENGRFDITSEQRFSEAIDSLDSEQQSIKCIVSSCVFSDYEPLELLTTVRDAHPHLPFIILTGENEPAASDAISAGATDYYKKGDGEKTYKLLANRIEQFVEQYQSQQERDRVYQALETAEEGIGLIAEDGEYIYVNEAYAELYDYDQDELIGEYWEQLYPDEEVERFYDKILPQLKQEGTWSGQSHGKRATGDIFPEELSLTHLTDGGHVCVVRDVSERIERERQFETVADNLQGMVYRVENTPEWPVEFAHGNLKDFLGYTIADLESQRIDWNDLIHPNDRQAVRDKVQAAVNSSERFELIYRVIDAGGQTKWVVDRGHGVEDDKGTVRMIVCVYPEDPTTGAV